MPRSSRLIGAALAAVLAVPAALAQPSAAPAAAPPDTTWQLAHSATFSAPVSSSSASWVRSSDGPTSRYNVDDYDDDGAYFQARGGAEFRRQLGTFRTYRKSFTFGSGGWLTAEMSARDANRDGRPDAPPTVRTEPVGSNSSLLLKEPSHHGGVVIRSTRALPAQYRIEVRLRTLDFGGQRNGSWDYPDGRINGYRPGGCKTNHPWVSGGDFTRPYCQWRGVRRDSNGFYFLSIMDYPRPAPHNNVFIHTHRKVVMDGYNRYKWSHDDMVYCNPLTKQYEPYSAGSGNGVNMLFNTAERHNSYQPGTAYLVESECGSSNGGPLVSAADLRPELMPRRTYRFAIERIDGGYTLEATGYFAHIGQATLRYHRKFVENGLPIWHYNQNAGEYDGAFNTDWTYPGPSGTYVDDNVWPVGSSYPDYFMIGDPHTNYYEGKAHIDDLKMYVPAPTQ